MANLKKSISPAGLNAELLNNFEKGNTGKTDLLELLSTKFKLGRNRYFAAYDSAHSEWMKMKAKGQEAAVIAGTIKKLSSGLKTKTERLLILQNLVDQSQKEIASIKSPEARVYARKAVKDIQAEISKIEGDYAPSKADLTTRGESFNPRTIIKWGDKEIAI